METACVDERVDVWRTRDTLAGMSDPSDLGVYGLRLRGAGIGPAIPGGAPADWPEVQLSVEPGAYPAAEAMHDEKRCVLPLRDHARTLIADRAAGTARFIGPTLDPEDLAHPYLGPVATIFARWHGREAFHGAGYMVGGRAYALLGAPQAGKSTIVAALAASGVPIVADDMLVMDRAGVYRGPRSVDLRRPLPAHLVDPAQLRIVRGRARHRYALPDQPATVPLGGWVFLVPGDELRVDPVAAPERLQVLARWRAWRERPSDPRLMLDLAAAPSWIVRAPQRWNALEATLGTLIGLGQR